MCYVYKNIKLRGQASSKRGHLEKDYLKCGTAISPDNNNSGSKSINL